jgi:hypothetical protein
MSTLSLGRLSESEAEIAIANVWQLIEEYSVASPRLLVGTLPHGQLEISLVFTSARDVERIAAGLRSAPSKGSLIANEDG